MAALRQRIETWSNRVMRVPKDISKANSTFQQLLAVKENRSKRTSMSRIFVEGVLPINLVRQVGIPIEQIFVTSGVRLSDWAAEIVTATPEAELFSLVPDLMSRISDKDQCPELVLVARMPDLHSLPTQANRVLVMDRPTSPGNLGSVLRSCDALGIDVVLLFGRSADPFDPKCIAASRGTVFNLKVNAVGSKQSLEAFLDACRTMGEFTIFGSSAKDGDALTTIQAPDRFALIVGNETTGMSSYLSSLTEVMLTIPMQGAASSLNLAVATSILLYHLVNP